MIQSVSFIFRAICLALIIALGPFAAPLAQAKIVAVLFDTSGSMDNRYQLPSFGARMLAATIDGRAGFDRLLIMNFNEYYTRWGSTIPGVDASMSAGSAPSIDDIIATLPANTIRDMSVTSQADHQALMDRLSRSFQYGASTGTPYGPIEVMLKKLEAEVTPGEEVVFVLVTDGGYNNENLFKNGALVPRMRTVFEGARDAITAKGGTLSVQYLFIDNLGGSNLRNIVREQGVRDTLTSVFNGDPAIGSKYVSNADQLWEALQDIIAEVAGTDRQAQSNFITYQGNEISLSTPLSISRVVTVSTGPRGRAPRLVSNTFSEQPTETRTVTTTMPGTDTALGSPAPRGGIVQHLYFQRAVPAGDYTLTFDAPVDRDVFLLFETRAVNQLQIFDGNGSMVNPSPTGEYRLFIGQEYEFRSQIIDGITTPTPVDFAVLPPSLSMALTLSDAQGPTTSSMVLDDTTDTGRFTWRPSVMGQLTASTRASAGVLSPRSDTLPLLVLDSTAEVTVSPITPITPCANCGQDEINVPLDVQGGTPIGTFDVTAEAEIDGQITFDNSDIPPGTEIRDENGTPVDTSKPYQFQAGTIKTFTLWRTENVTPEDIAAGIPEIVIQAAPTGDWGGQAATAQTKARVDAPDMTIKLVDVTQPITAGTIDGLKVPTGELLRGAFAAQYTLVSLLTAPDPAEIDNLITVTSTGPFARLISLNPSFPDPAVTGFNAVEVKPDTSFWCLCWIWGANTVTGSDKRDVTVAYTYTVSDVVLQSAETTVPFAYPIRFVPQAGLSCALNLLYAIIAWFILRGIWAIFTTHRFPKGSMVEIVRGTSAPSYRRLDKGSGLWWRVWLAAITGNPDQKKTIEGLRMQATHKGAMVNIAKDTPPWRLERLDASFQELKETQPKKTEHRLMWGDRLDSTVDPKLSMRLKRRRAD